MKGNKKGFTLIELLAVIVIISILATLVVVSITKYKQVAKEQYLSSLESQLELAAKDYFTNNNVELPKGQIVDGKKILTTSVNAQYLNNSNYFTNKLVDDEGNDCSSESYVVVKNINGNYNYEPCLICNGKVMSENEQCEIGGNDTVVDAPYCTISVESLERYEKKLIVNANTTTAIEAVNEDDLIKQEDGSYIAYKPGTYSFKVTNDNGEAICSTTIYMDNDSAKPTCTVSKVDSIWGYSKVTFNYQDETALKKVTYPDGTTEEYECSYDKYITSGISEEKKYYRLTDEKTYTMTVEDCAGNINTCSVTIEKSVASGNSSGTSGGNNDGVTDICPSGEDCGDDDDDSSSSCKKVCYAGKSSDYNYTTCKYYQCSSDGCSGSWQKISGCTPSEENPSTGADVSCYSVSKGTSCKSGYTYIEDAVGDTMCCR